MNTHQQPSTSENDADHGSRGVMFSLWCMAAAFGTYFAMYGLRKPFTAGGYSEINAWGMDFKTVLVTAQVLGYTLAKFLGIKFISETPPERRVFFIFVLNGLALLFLLGFALIPAPYSFVFLFFNGLSLGMVFGFVLRHLEGRRQTEVLAAGLCASFILADGVAKSVGAWLLAKGVPEQWMPFSAGLMFLAPMMGFLWMLRRVPVPSVEDLRSRRARSEMKREDRVRYFKTYAPGLIAIIAPYMLITIMRSVRADFAPELWKGLGVAITPGIFSLSEMWVALAVIAVSGFFSLFRDNKLAFLASLYVSVLGFLVLLGTLFFWRVGFITPFMFMVLIGLGLYVPYVVVHTTVFERLIALTPERGNIGYLMYLADAFGYLAYVGVMAARNVLPEPANVLEFFTSLSWITGILGGTAFVISAVYFKIRLGNMETEADQNSPSSARL